MSGVAKSLLRKNQEAQEARDARFVQTLNRKKLTQKDEVDITKLWDEIPYDHTRIVRDNNSFKQSIKSKDIGKIKETLAWHRYGKFAVPRHLKLIWHYSPTVDHWGRKIGKLPADEQADRKAYYICVASGGSLYKEITQAFFTKKETHRFLNAPNGVSFEEAIIYAYGMGYTSNVSDVMRCYKSKLINQNVRASQFWRDVLRFFCVNPVPIAKMNDFIDYIGHARRENQEYSIKGRTIRSLSVEMEQWHRTLARAKRMGNANWKGFPVENKSIEVKSNGKYYIWTLTQILTSKDLAEEGSKMHHCVYSYQSQCIAGRTSIWSLKYYIKGLEFNKERALTIEVNDQARVVQVRGYGNRMPRYYEENALTELCSLAGFRYDVNRFHW